MSENQSIAIVRIAQDPTKPPRTVHLSSEDAVPHRKVEVVSDADKRYEEDVRHKAESPNEFFKQIPIVEPPVVLGAEVGCESLLGFLDAIEKILPPETNYPILSSAKIVFEPAEPPRLYLEAGSHSVWTLVALKATARSDKGFLAVVPVKRAKNILLSLREAGPNVVIGVDDLGIGIGPHTVPFGGPIDDFPTQPVIGEWDARAAMPAAYFRSICTRVMLARSDDFKDQTLNGVLLDFEFHVIDGITKPICTAVATDGARIHILRLPQMMIDVRATRLRALPPTCIVSAGFFEYMREIVQHEWVGLEFSAGQLVARGDDYVTVAKVSIEGRSSTRDLASWRKVNIEHPGHWLAAAPKIAQVVKSASLGDTAEECRLQIDGIKDRLTISSSNKSGDRFSESISVRGFDGPPLVDLNLSVPYLRDALLASQSGLVRLSFSHDLAIQATSPVVIRGEDEQFKAIIMPRAQESS